MAVKLAFLGSHVYVLTLAGPGEHRFSLECLSEILAALDTVEADSNARALVTTGEGKFFSNGLVVSLRAGDRESPANMLLFDQFQELMKRMLSFPMPTVAAVTGHAVGSGCMFALAHDYRFMRADRGFMFLPEIDNKFPISPGVNGMIRSKLPVMTYQKAMLSAFRYTGKEAFEAGMVHASPPDAQATFQEAWKLAKDLASRNFNRGVYRTMKEVMFEAEIQQLGIPFTLEPLIDHSKL